MRTNKEIKEAYADNLRALSDLQEKTDGRMMTEQESKEWKALQKRSNEILQEETELAEVLARKSATWNVVTHAPKLQGLAGGARALFSGKTTTITEGNIGEFVDLERRDFNSTTGAATVQNPFLSPASGIIFDPIYSTVLKALGFDIFDLVANHYKYPKVTGYPTGGFYTESEPIPTGDPMVDSVQFTAKNWGLLIKVHNNLLRDAGPLSDAIIQGVFTRAIELMFLSSALYGSTGDGSFVGLDNAPNVQTLSAGSAPLTDYDLIAQAGEMVMSANGMPDNISSVMHPKVWRQLQLAKDTTGQQLVKPNGLANWPMRNSTTVKLDYGAGSDETRVYVGDFSTVKLGIEGRYEMRLDQTFAADDVTAFAMVVRADMQLFHPEHIVRIEDVATA